MKYLKTYNERLGVNKDVIETSEKIMEFIKKNFANVDKKIPIEYPIEMWDDWMLESKTIKSFHIIYEPDVWSKKRQELGSMSYRISENEKKHYLNFGLSFSKKNVSFSTIVHEIQHMYEDTKKFDPIKGIVPEFKPARDWAYGYSRKRQMDKYINKFFTCVYLAQNQEINSRVQETYVNLIKSMKEIDTFWDEKTCSYIKTNSKEFIKSIKKTNAYSIAKGLQNAFSKEYLKDPKKSKALVNRLKLLKKHQLWTSPESESNKYDPIGLMFEFYFKNVIPMIKNVTSEEESIRFLKYYDNFFTKQGKKFERKLFKLYDLLINNL